MTIARNESAPPYLIAPVDRTDDDLIAAALAVLDRRNRTGQPMASPQNVKDYLRLKLAPFEQEVFAVLFLDTQHRVIEFVEMFRGTLSQASVYPREVVKQALALNAGAVILSHNHPSGHAEPSRADEHLTQTLKAALAMVDVRVLDHVVVSTGGTVSMAERGLM